MLVTLYGIGLFVTIGLAVVSIAMHEYGET
jgi:hypothetical protein